MLPITIESGTRVEWRAPGPQGIQGATGPTGMPSSLYDAKGDLIVGSANDTPTRLPVGNDGDLLVASSGATPGLAWRAPSPITASATGVTLNRAQPVVVNPAGDGAKTWTLPPAADNYGVQFTCINDDTATVTINRSGSDLIAGSLTTTSIPGPGTLRLVSDGTGWRVIDGSYDSDTVGLASYEWRRSGTPGWRLIAYDSGLRDVSASLPAAHLTLNPNAIGRLQRIGRMVTFHYDSGASPTATGVQSVLTSAVVTDGFRFSAAAAGIINITGTLNPGSGALQLISLYLSGATSVSSATHVSGTRASGSLSWFTNDAPPASLPGTQITAPA